FFFFQAEDGIRDDLVTGVQTCALPILSCFMVAGFNRLESLLTALVIPFLLSMAIMLTPARWSEIKLQIGIYKSWNPMLDNSSFEIGRASCRERVYMLVDDCVVKVNIH